MIKYVIQADNLNELYVRLVCNGRESHYKVSLGYPGKHGLQGCNNSDLLCFEGGKVLVQPEYCYIDYNVKEDIVDISVIKNNTACNMRYENLDLFDFYDLRKKCFAFGSFDTYRHFFDLECSLNLHFQKNACFNNENVRNLIIHKTIILFNYYEDIFGKLNQKEYNIYFLDYTDNKNIFAGAGRTSQGLTFDPGRERDWELLSHRMFHAFFDSNMRISSMLKPPYLWLYEGLAVYCEIESVKLLGITGNWEKLRKRYDFALTKYEAKLQLDPFKEAEYIKCGYKTEFLHYTQAPLIINQNKRLNIFEMLKSNNDPDNILKFMDISIDHKPFIEEPDNDLKYFDYILKTWRIEE